MKNFYCVQDCDTLQVLEYGDCYEALLYKYSQQNRILYEDIYIFEALLLIDRRTHQVIEYAVDYNTLFKKLSADIIEDFSKPLNDMNYYIGHLSNFGARSDVYVNLDSKEYIVVPNSHFTAALMTAIETHHFTYLTTVKNTDTVEQLLQQRGLHVSLSTLQAVLLPSTELSIEETNRYSWVFLNEDTQTYIVVPDRELTDEGRWNIQACGFELLTDNIAEWRVRDYMKEFYPDAKPAKYEPMPITLKEAQNFINKHHRHHKQPQGHKYSTAIAINNVVIGVLVAGRAVSRHLDNRHTLEVTRCCVLEGFKNAVSKLYGQIYRAAKSFGFKKIITYTLNSEAGVSMRALGFEQEAFSKGGSWNSLLRKRADKHPLSPKIRWSKSIQ